MSNRCLLRYVVWKLFRLLLAHAPLGKTNYSKPIKTDFLMLLSTLLMCLLYHNDLFSPFLNFPPPTPPKKKIPQPRTKNSLHWQWSDLEVFLLTRESWTKSQLCCLQISSIGSAVSIIKPRTQFLKWYEPWF